MLNFDKMNSQEDFPQAFQRQFRRSLGVPGDPEAQQGGGGGPMPIPEGGPGWRQQQEGFPGGGGGPMPIPEGGPNWKNLPPTGTGGFHPGGQVLQDMGGPGNFRDSIGPNPWNTSGPLSFGEGSPGGGGGPMPIPDPDPMSRAADLYRNVKAQGGNVEDYGMTDEFGGPGAVNPINPTTGMVMNPAQLRQHYAQPAPQQPQGPGRMMGGQPGGQFNAPFNRPQRPGNDGQRQQPQGGQQGWDPQTGWNPGRKQQGWGHQTGWGQGAPAGTGGFNFQQAMPKPQGNWNWGDNSNIFRRKF